MDEENCKEQFQSSIASTSNFVNVPSTLSPTTALTPSCMVQQQHQLLPIITPAQQQQSSPPLQSLSSSSSPNSSICSTNIPREFLYVRIKQKHICVLLSNLDKISVLFGAKLVHAGSCVNNGNGQQYFVFQTVPESPDTNPISITQNIQVSLAFYF